MLGTSFSKHWKNESPATRRPREKFQALEKVNADFPNLGTMHRPLIFGRDDDFMQGFFAALPVGHAEGQKLVEGFGVVVVF